MTGGKTFWDWLPAFRWGEAVQDIQTPPVNWTSPASIVVQAITSFFSWIGGFAWGLILWMAKTAFDLDLARDMSARIDQAVAQTGAVLIGGIFFGGLLLVGGLLTLFRLVSGKGDRNDVLKRFFVMLICAAFLGLYVYGAQREVDNAIDLAEDGYEKQTEVWNKEVLLSSPITRQVGTVTRTYRFNSSNLAYPSALDATYCIPKGYSSSYYSAPSISYTSSSRYFCHKDYMTKSEYTNSLRLGTTPWSPSFWIKTLSGMSNSIGSYISELQNLAPEDLTAGTDADQNVISPSPFDCKHYVAELNRRANLWAEEETELNLGTRELAQAFSDIWLLTSYQPAAYAQWGDSAYAPVVYCRTLEALSGQSKFEQFEVTVDAAAGPDCNMILDTDDSEHTRDWKFRWNVGSGDKEGWPYFTDDDGSIKSQVPSFCETSTNSGQSDTGSQQEDTSSISNLFLEEDIIKILGAPYIITSPITDREENRISLLSAIENAVDKCAVEEAVFTITYDPPTEKNTSAENRQINEVAIHYGLALNTSDVPGYHPVFTFSEIPDEDETREVITVDTYSQKGNTFKLAADGDNGYSYFQYFYIPDTSITSESAKKAVAKAKQTGNAAKDKIFLAVAQMYKTRYGRHGGIEKLKHTGGFDVTSSHFAFSDLYNSLIDYDQNDEFLLNLYPTIKNKLHGPDPDKTISFSEPAGIRDYSFDGASSCFKLAEFQYWLGYSGTNGDRADADWEEAVEFLCFGDTNFAPLSETRGHERWFKTLSAGLDGTHVKGIFNGELGEEYLACSTEMLNLLILCDEIPKGCTNPSGDNSGIEQVSKVLDEVGRIALYTGVGAPFGIGAKNLSNLFGNRSEHTTIQSNVVKRLENVQTQICQSIASPELPVVNPTRLAVCADGVDNGLDAEIRIETDKGFNDYKEDRFYNYNDWIEVVGATYISAYFAGLLPLPTEYNSKPEDLIVSGIGSNISYLNSSMDSRVYALRTNPELQAILMPSLSPIAGVSQEAGNDLPADLRISELLDRSYNEEEAQVPNPNFFPASTFQLFTKPINYYHLVRLTNFWVLCVPKKGALPDSYEPGSTTDISNSYWKIREPFQNIEIKFVDNIHEDGTKPVHRPFSNAFEHNQYNTCAATWTGAAQLQGISSKIASCDYGWFDTGFVCTTVRRILNLFGTGPRKAVAGDITNLKPYGGGIFEVTAGQYDLPAGVRSYSENAAERESPAVDAATDWLDNANNRSGPGPRAATAALIGLMTTLSLGILTFALLGLVLGAQLAIVLGMAFLPLVLIVGMWPSEKSQSGAGRFVKYMLLAVLGKTIAVFCLAVLTMMLWIVTVTAQTLLGSTGLFALLTSVFVSILVFMFAKKILATVKSIGASQGASPLRKALGTGEHEGGGLKQMGRKALAGYKNAPGRLAARSSAGDDKAVKGKKAVGSKVVDSKNAPGVKRPPEQKTASQNSSAQGHGSKRPKGSSASPKSASSAKQADAKRRLKAAKKLI